MAIFIVLNTFLMNLGERRAQLAILRAVGATQWQIRRVLLAESLVMGVVGSVLGALLGWGGARLLLGTMAKWAESAPFELHLSWPPFALAGGLGIGVALLGTWLPVRRAGRISPMEAVRAGTPQAEQAVSRRVTAVGAVLFVAAGVVVTACIRGWLPTHGFLFIPAGVAFLATFVLLIPLLVPPLARAVRPLLAPLTGPVGHLAEQQLSRRRARAGLTVGVLYIAIGAGVGLGTTMINHVQDVRNWHHRTMQGDLFVRANSPTWPRAHPSRCRKRSPKRSATWPARTTSRPCEPSAARPMARPCW